MEIIKIPLFPLNIFPLPGELVPLHIFEPRYRQLLYDAEAKDFEFGIFFQNEANIRNYGALVRLESVIKRFSGGEVDIIVKCVDLFELVNFHNSFRDRLYPGGVIKRFNVDLSLMAGTKLLLLFAVYLEKLRVFHPPASCSIFHVANELNLDVFERVKFLNLPNEGKERFLIQKISYQIKLIEVAEQAKDIFHLN